MDSRRSVREVWPRCCVASRSVQVIEEATLQRRSGSAGYNMPGEAAEKWEVVGKWAGRPPLAFLNAAPLTIYIYGGFFP